MRWDMGHASWLMGTLYTTRSDPFIPTTRIILYRFYENSPAMCIQLVPAVMCVLALDDTKALEFLQLYNVI